MDDAVACGACGAEVDVRGAFPGATLRCACGGSVTVPLPAPSPGPFGAGPYRAAAPRPPKPPSARFVARPPRPSSPCPRCGDALAGAELRGRPLSRCASCEGTFVDFDAVAALVAEVRAELAPGAADPAPPRPASKDVRYVQCPRCRETMNRTNFGGRSGIVIDLCREHGTWFDRGELEAALHYVRIAGVAPSVKPPAPKAPRATDEGARAAAYASVALLSQTAQEVREVRVGSAMARFALGGPVTSLLDVLLD